MILDMIYELLKSNGGIVFGGNVAFKNEVEKDGPLNENSSSHTLVLRNEKIWSDLFVKCGFKEIKTSLLDGRGVQKRLQNHNIWRHRVNGDVGFIVFSAQKI